MSSTRHVDVEYDQIKDLLLTMGGKVEEMVAQATQALTERGSDQALEVIRSDREVDELEKRIDNESLTLLALQQPTAKDLRFLVAVMKITTDLERIGDSAANICRAVRDLAREAPFEAQIDLPKMSTEVRRMLRESLDAFVRRDAELALDVWKRDDEIDRLDRRFYDQLVEAIAERPESVQQAMRMIQISRTFERIADHATNIAEDVIYYVEGRDIRHSATDYGESASKASE
ncbi:MAG: phosphate signaling complex protein PhoU [Acidobacteriota bacterium]